ncbi:MAG: hypothetical protein ACYC3L_01030, partial [Gemmatimonadaceae bacterium]
MTWTVVVSDNFTRANTSPGGAGTTTGAGNNWIDEAGGVYSISSNTLLATTSNTTGYLTQTLLRPSGEAATGQRITATFVAVSSTQANSGILLRGQSGDFYFGHLDFASPALHIYKVVGGAVTSL